MGRFSDQVHLSIAGFTKNVIYSNLQISQKMADHHYFSFTWHYSGQVKIDAMDQADDTSRYMSSEVIFTFKVNGIKLMSKGIITGLGINYLKGAPDGFQVRGVSHTIILDETPKSRVFLEKNLQQIACDVFDEEMSDEFYQRNAIQPTYKKTFDHLTQYNESNFDFMKRIAARYGQWFYFDGMRMQFGQIKSSNVKLINNVSIHKFTIENQLASHKASFGGYDYNTATNIRNASLKTDTGSKDRFSSIMNYNQIVVSRPELNTGSYTPNARNSDEIKEMVHLQNAARDANSVFYSGTSYFPIGLGQTFTIDNKSVVHELLAVEITHLSDINGSYFCEFVAIPADVAAPHYTNPACFGKAESQPAKIKDNNDPEGLGRVRVAFNWASGYNVSEWMRVAQFYAGPGRGSLYTPEIGDEVIVSFEGGNIDVPFVLASNYNGQAKPEFFDSKNSIKGWKLRFGMLFKFIEKIGIWLSDPSGNEIHLDEETKSITITTPETLTLNCKNLIINASESMTTNVTVNKTDIVGVNSSESVGGVKEIGIGGDFNNVVGGKYFEHIKGDFKSKTDKERYESGKEGLHNNAEKNISKNAQKEIKHNSGESTRQN